MSRIATSLLFILSLMPSVTSAESVFRCYAAMTEIGTVARRDFTDQRGFVMKTILYGSREDGVQPACSEANLRIQSVRTFERDALGRVVVERHDLFPALLSLVRYEYGSDDMWPARRTQFGRDGSRRYEIRYSGRQERSHIYFDRSGRVAGINGDMPSDLILAFEWGSEADGWTCGIALAKEHDGGLREINLHLRNRSNTRVSTPFIQFFETELRDNQGRIIDLTPEFTATLATMPRTGGINRLLNPGETAFYSFDLNLRYGRLAPGRYSLAVRYPHPVTGTDADLKHADVRYSLTRGRVRARERPVRQRAFRADEKCVSFRGVTFVPRTILEECPVQYESRTGAVLFARRLDQVAAFYANVLGLREAHRDADHILLESPGFQLVVHRIPGDAAAKVDVAEPPVRRASAAFKPVFFVQSLATVRAIANAHGGAMDASDKEWSFNGVLVCDALDPEGNVVQFREAHA